MLDEEKHHGWRHFDLRTNNDNRLPQELPQPTLAPLNPVDAKTRDELHSLALFTAQRIDFVQRPDDGARAARASSHSASAAADTDDDEEMPDAN